MLDAAWNGQKKSPQEPEYIYIFRYLDIFFPVGGLFSA
jgi:hypothetical protein